MSMIKTKLIIAASVMLGALILSCSTMTTAEREAKKAEKAKYVAKVLSNKHYKIDVTMMYPLRGGAQNVTSNWSLEVKGDTLVSYLPYVGVSHEAILGSNKGLNFTAPIKSYKDSGFKNGKRTIDLKANNDEEDLEYRIEVMDNGSSTIDVTSRRKDGIGFSGNISDD